MKGLKIKNYLDVVLDESMVSHGKSYPEIYLKVAGLQNTKPKNYVVFENGSIKIRQE